MFGWAGAAVVALVLTVGLAALSVRRRWMGLRGGHEGVWYHRGATAEASGRGA